jgi:hypothetical protein
MKIIFETFNFINVVKEVNSIHIVNKKRCKIFAQPFRYTHVEDEDEVCIGNNLNSVKQAHERKRSSSSHEPNYHLK